MYKQGALSRSFVWSNSLPLVSVRIWWEFSIRVHESSSNLGIDHFFYANHRIKRQTCTRSTSILVLKSNHGKMWNLNLPAEFCDQQKICKMLISRHFASPIGDVLVIFFPSNQWCHMTNRVFRVIFEHMANIQWTSDVTENMHLFQERISPFHGYWSTIKRTYSSHVIYLYFGCGP